MEHCVRNHFIEYNNVTAQSLCEFSMQLSLFAVHVQSFEVCLSIPCVLVNIFHLIILTRKSMRKSSVNLMMITLTISDILYLIHQFFPVFINFLTFLDGCVETRKYAFVLAEISSLVLSDFAKRYSAWICLSIALIRTLIMRRPWTSFFDNKFTAFITIVGVFIASVGFSVFKAFEYEIVSIENVDFCNLAIKIATFKYAVAHIFAKRGGSFVKTIHTTECIFSSIIPCILFPIFTFLLLVEVRKAEKHRVEHLACPANNKRSRKTTKLVLYLTIAFLIAGFPLGVTNACTYIFAESPGFLIIFTRFSDIFDLLLTVNTSTNFFVCIMVSSHYRRRAKSMILCGDRNREQAGNSVAIVLH